jgi:hypothetical protein
MFTMFSASDQLCLDMSPLTDQLCFGRALAARDLYHFSLGLRLDEALAVR